MATLSSVYILVRVQKRFSFITSLVDGWVVVVRSIGHLDHSIWTPISFFFIKIWGRMKYLVQQ
jgi:hypothetical protein